MKTLLASLAVATVAMPLAAHADVRIAFWQSGVNGGALTEMASGANFATTAGAYGTFNVNDVAVSSATGLLDSTALNISSATPGEILVFVTATDVVRQGAQAFLSSLTSNLLPSGWTADLNTWLDPSDIAYNRAIELGDHVFSAIGTDVEDTVFTPSAPFSVTGVYDITATGSGTSLLTLHVDAVPIAEPASLALVASAFLSFGLLRWQGHSK